MPNEMLTKKYRVLIFHTFINVENHPNTFEIYGKYMIFKVF